jgi:hypothetical protein
MMIHAILAFLAVKYGAILLMTKNLPMRSIAYTIPERV